MTGTGPRQLNRPGTWGPRGTRERTSASTWAKPRRWAKLAREGKLPDGSPNLDGHRPRIFCASLADVFEPRAELEPWRRELFDLIEATPELDWLLLTKRPEEARDWLRWYYADGATGALTLGREWSSRDGLGWGVLPNVWVGTSIGTAEFTWRADVLRQIPAAVRFISAEPLLSSLFEGRPPGGVSSAPDVARDGVGVQDRAVGSAGSSPALSTLEERVLPSETRHGHSTPDAQSGPEAPRARGPLDLTGIDWVIVGGESGGRHARPMHPAWAREIRDVVLATGTQPLLPLEDEAHCPSCGDDQFTCVDPDRCRDADGYRVHFPRPALHFKQWGSWAPAGFVSGLRGAEDPSVKASDARNASTVDDGDQRWLTYYRGSSPKSAGKLLDGVEFCEFPTGAGALTPA